LLKRRLGFSASALRLAALHRAPGRRCDVGQPPQGCASLGWPAVLCDALKGNQAHGRNERPNRWKRRWDATDSSVEKSPGVYPPGEVALAVAPGNGCPGRRQLPRRNGERQEGNGRGDAVRLLARGTLRRV
jgi:hypothetical protein